MSLLCLFKNKQLVRSPHNWVEMIVVHHTCRVSRETESKWAKTALRLLWANVAALLLCLMLFGQ